MECVKIVDINVNHVLLLNVYIVRILLYITYHLMDIIVNHVCWKIVYIVINMHFMDQIFYLLSNMKYYKFQWHIFNYKQHALIVLMINTLIC